MSDRLFSHHAFAGELGEPTRVRLQAALSTFHVATSALVTRRELHELDERMLADIGLTRAEAAAEAARLPWDLGPLRKGAPRPQRQGNLWRLMHDAWRRHTTRRRITELDAHALKDIGVTYAEAEAEANKPFWRF